MQEIAILLSSVAGVFSAAALKKYPKSRGKIESAGTNSYIQSKINSLSIEKEILTKSISRLYDNDPSITKIQRDKLLLRYQHQLGVILAKIEKLEVAGKHPDLGPLGDGLITLMDQKLSSLDERLHELSTKISSKNDRQEIIEKPKVSLVKEQKSPQSFQTQESSPSQISVPVNEISSKIHLPVELTTLTEIPKKPLKFPFEIFKRSKDSDEVDDSVKKEERKIEIIQSDGNYIPFKTEIKPESQQKDTLEQIQKESITEPEKKDLDSAFNLPEEESIDDDDDLDKIKGQILKTLSKLQQAEVE